MASSVKIRDSIATRLLTIVFSIYFMVTMTVTTVHMFAEYLNTKESIKEDLAIFHKTFEESIGATIWNLDAQQLRSTLSGIIKIPSIVGVKVFDGENNEFGSIGRIYDKNGNNIHIDVDGNLIEDQRNLKLADLFLERFPLMYLQNGNLIKVGEVELYSSNGVVFNKVQYGFIFIIVNSIIKTMALWLIFLIVGQYILSKPLAKFTEATQELSMDSLENFKLKIETKGRNELKILEEAFNLMVHKLIQAKNRTTSLRIFANSIAGYADGIETMRFAFKELGECIDCSDAALYLDTSNSGGQSQLRDHRHIFLLKNPAQRIGDQIFRDAQAEIEIFNHVNDSSPILHHYQGSGLNNSHFLFVRIHEIPHVLLTFFRESNREIFDSNDVEYIKSMVHEIKTAQNNIHSIREKARMENELKTAAAVQQALFPKSIPQFPGMDFATFFQSSSETGGDWFGFISDDQRYLYIMIGDVTGHGTPAALVTATAAATCRTLQAMAAQMGTPLTPAHILGHLNQAVLQTGAPNFLMTFFIAQIDLLTGVMSYSNAGHNFPIVIDTQGNASHLLNANFRLGWDANTLYSEENLQLKDGDLLFFYTDGLIENTNPNNVMWGEHSLVRYLRKNNTGNIHEMVQDMIRGVYQFYDGCPIQDDVTIVACKINGSFAEQA